MFLTTRVSPVKCGVLSNLLLAPILCHTVDLTPSRVVCVVFGPVAASGSRFRVEGFAMDLSASLGASVRPQLMLAARARQKVRQVDVANNFL